MTAPKVRAKRWSSTVWSLWPIGGKGERDFDKPRVYVRVDKETGERIEICWANSGSAMMEVTTLKRRDARLLAKRITQCLEQTK